MRKKSFAEYSLKRVIVSNMLSLVLYIVGIIVALNIGKISEFGLVKENSFLADITTVIMLMIFLIPVGAGIIGGVVSLFIKPMKNGRDNIKQYIMIIIINLVIGSIYFLGTKSILMMILFYIFALGGPLIVASLKHSMIKINEAE